MRRIYKYPLTIDDTQTVMIPDNSTILTVALQYGKPVLWVEVDTEETLRKRIIYTRGTGHDLKDVHGVYLGTYQKGNGAFVFHVYVGVWDDA